MLVYQENEEREAENFWGGEGRRTEEPFGNCFN